MPAYSFGDIVLVDFPFADRSAEKRRPGLVLALDPHGDLLLARITSKPAELATDVILQDWQQEGLNIHSTVRLLKLTTTNSANILRTLGRASANDRNNVVRSLMEFVKTLE